MPQHIQALEDGSWLIVMTDSPLDIDQEAPNNYPGHFLGLTDFLVEAAAAGVAGNLTFGLLRTTAQRLTDRLGITGNNHPVAADIVENVSVFLTNNGYSLVTVSQVSEVVEGGWLVQGTVDAGEFNARTEPAGRVMHIRVS